MRSRSRPSARCPRSEPAERARFLELLHHEDRRVRYVAAVHAFGRGMAEQEALEVLRALAAGDDEVAQRAQDRIDDHRYGDPVELD